MKVSERTIKQQEGGKEAKMTKRKRKSGSTKMGLPFYVWRVKRRCKCNATQNTKPNSREKKILLA
jgi:hypothetical protein